MAGIRVVKSFVREAYETEKFDKAAEEVRKDFTFVEKILAFNNPTMMFCMYLSMFLVYYLGARIIVNTGATELTTGPGRNEDCIAAFQRLHSKSFHAEAL